MSQSYKNRIAIVGGGFGMVALLDGLLARGLTRTQIDIYAKNHDEIGEAYKAVPDVFIMNTQTAALGMFDHILPLGDWLKTGVRVAPANPDYLPRRVFGQYLNHVRARLINAHRLQGNEIELLPAVDFLDGDGQIHDINGQVRAAGSTVLSLGFGSDTQIAETARRILSVPQGGRLSVIGSGLTGIDMILLSTYLRPDISIDCYSLSGRFPRVRSNFTTGLPSVLGDLVTAPDVRLRDVLHRVESCASDGDDLAMYRGDLNPSDELAYAKERISLTQQAMYNATRDYAEVFRRMPDTDRSILMRHRPTFVERRVMYPLCNAEKIQDLCTDGVLHIHRKAVNPRDIDPETTLRAMNDSSPLGRFAQRSGLRANPFGGVMGQRDGCVCDKRGIYALGPITNGFRYFTEASSITKRDAELACDALMARLSRTTERMVAEL